jgi:hypothetical protein
MILYAVICTFIALCFSKKDFEHLFAAIAMSIALTPIGGYYFYRFMFKDEIKAERLRRRDQEALRRERILKQWYLDRIPDAEADRINSLPTHAERSRAAQEAVDRIIAHDRHNPNAPIPPFRSFY